MENRFEELKKKALEKYQEEVLKDLEEKHGGLMFFQMLKEVALTSFSVGFDYGYDNGNIEGLKDAERN